jgi:Mg2+/Co2+ transporter CorB
MKPYFIPETTTLDDQMRNFLRRHTHFALVVDEYGALRGLITLEDILEEIVGEITDEFDTPDAPVLTPDAQGNYEIDGAMTIRDFNRATDWSLPDEEANTLAGLVIHEAQTIPVEGQCFSFHGVRFEVAERDKNRLTRLRVRKLCLRRWLGEGALCEGQAPSRSPGGIFGKMKEGAARCECRPLACRSARAGAQGRGAARIGGGT